MIMIDISYNSLHAMPWVWEGLEHYFFDFENLKGSRPKNGQSMVRQTVRVPETE